MTKKDKIMEMIEKLEGQKIEAEILLEYSETLKLNVEAQKQNVFLKGQIKSFDKMLEWLNKKILCES